MSLEPCPPARDSLTAIIAIGWTPHYGRNHMDAIIDSIATRMQQGRRSRVSRDSRRTPMVA
eukprot:1944921-Prymnesium_polylepis.1